jgi:hypothetical protein
MARYLGPADTEFARPGSDARYRQNNLLEDVARGPADAQFSRWWLLNGEHISGYVEDCRVFMLVIKKTVEEMLCKLSINRISTRDYIRRELYTDLDGMKHKIHQWMKENSRVTAALECLQNALPFTDEERLQFRTVTELYPRANLGHLLIKKVYLDLTQLPVNAAEQRVVRLLNSLMTALEPGSSWV